MWHQVLHQSIVSPVILELHLLFSIYPSKFRPTSYIVTFKNNFVNMSLLDSEIVTLNPFLDQEIVLRDL